MKQLLYFLFCLLFCSSCYGNDDIVGFWKTINEETGKQESLVAIYGYQGKFYGRIIVTYNEKGEFSDSIENPKTRAPGIVGEPFYSGLDFIWDLQKEGSKYELGKICDPQLGRIYSAEAWIEKGNLIMRGEILFFGRNQIWPPATEGDFPPQFKKPDLTKLIPVIPQVKS